MKAAVLREIKRPLSIEEVQVSKPGPHEVLVRTAAAEVPGAAREARSRGWPAQAG